VAQIIDHGWADIAWERESVHAAPFAMHDDLPRSPVDVVKAQSRDLASAKTES
jgi:hypothetical protein